MKKIPALIICLILCFGTVITAYSAEDELSVSSVSAVLMDASSRKVLYEKNPHKKVYPASVTKIMPMLLVMEALEDGKIKKDDKVSCSAEAASKGGSQIWLREGESMTVDELLRACAIASANDACCALGEYIAGSEEAFVAMMNKRAEELGMKQTHFENCSGLDDDTDKHLTSAYDVALMSAELLSHSEISGYSTKWMDSLRGGATMLVNTNKLVRFYEGTTGLKTGTTSKAGCCISASAEKNGIHLIAVVMGAKTSDERFEDAKKLLNYGFANFESVTPSVGKDDIEPVRVLNGTDRYVEGMVESVELLTLKKGSAEKLEYKIEICENVSAPVEKGQKLGEIIYSLDGKELCRYQIRSIRSVEKKSLKYVLFMILKSYSAVKNPQKY